MSLWRTSDGQDWVLIPISEHERAYVERVREAMQHILAACLGDDVALCVRTGKLIVYLQGVNAADHRQASVAVLRAQTQLARYYALVDPGDRLALAASLADDFAARYRDELAREAPR
jgi:hypothetical protein